VGQKIGYKNYFILVILKKIIKRDYHSLFFYVKIINQGVYMNSKIKDYVFIFYIFFLPFTLLLISLRLNNVGMFNDKMYYYIIYAFTIIMIISFVWSLVYTLDDIIYREESIVIRNMKIALLMIFSLLYPSIHYISNYYKKFRFISIFLLILNVFTIHYLLNSFNNYNGKLQSIITRDSIAFTEKFDYYFYKNKFKINVDYGYMCNNNAGDYILSCEDNRNDSFIGAYKYNLIDHTEEDLEDIYNYHLEQTMNYILEEGYEYSLEEYYHINIIKYNNMFVYITYKDYDTNRDFKNDLRLIIINEKSKESINDFIKLVNSIELNR